MACRAAAGWGVDRPITPQAYQGAQIQRAAVKLDGVTEGERQGGQDVGRSRCPGSGCQQGLLPGSCWAPQPCPPGTELSPKNTSSGGERIISTVRGRTPAGPKTLARTVSLPEANPLQQCAVLKKKNIQLSIRKPRGDPLKQALVLKLDVRLHTHAHMHV